MEVIRSSQSRMEDQRSLGKVALIIVLIWILIEAWCFSAIFKYNKIVLEYMKMDLNEERRQYARINLLEGDLNERENQTYYRELEAQNYDRTNRQCRINRL